MFRLYHEEMYTSPRGRGLTFLITILQILFQPSCCLAVFASCLRVLVLYFTYFLIGTSFVFIVSYLYFRIYIYSHIYSPPPPKKKLDFLGIFPKYRTL